MKGAADRRIERYVSLRPAPLRASHESLPGEPSGRVCGRPFPRWPVTYSAPREKVRAVSDIGAIFFAPADESQIPVLGFHWVTVGLKMYRARGAESIIESGERKTES